MLDIERPIVVRAVTTSRLRHVDSTRVPAPIGIQDAEIVTSAASELVADSIEREPAAVVGARVLAVGAEVCVVTDALAIDPDGVVLVPVVVMREAVVEVAGEDGLGHEGAEDGDSGDGELHCAVVFGVGLRMKWQ